MLLSSVSPLLCLITAIFYIVGMIFTVMDKKRQPEEEARLSVEVRQQCEKPSTVAFSSVKRCTVSVVRRKQQTPVVIYSVFYPPDAGHTTTPFYKIVFSRPPPVGCV